MQSSTSTGLTHALEHITRLDEEIRELEAQIKERKAQRSHYETLAIEEMQTQRLDGVRVAGRSWRIEIEHSVTVGSGVKGEIVDAARRAGIDDMVTIPTTSLKAYLKERAREAGRGPDQPWADGTEFAGLVGEYIRPVLRHLTTH